jgi:cell division protein FtsI (penicillin-binding protein 3)
MNKLSLRIKKNIITVVKSVIYYMFYLRIFLLKSKHILFVRRKRLYNLITEIKNLFLHNLSKKSLFHWQLSGQITHKRIHYLIAGFSLVFILLIVRLLTIAGSNYVNYKNSTGGKISHRIDIIDRNNNLLAVNLPAASLYANPKKVIDPAEALRKLLQALPDLDKKKTLEDLKSNKNFVWIKRDITPREHEKIYNLGMPGFGFEKEQKRIYPYGRLASHILGYVGRDMKGLAGIEKFFEKFLTGQQEMEDRSSLGNALQLSIDVRVQNILSEEIEYVMKKFSAKGAAGIIANPNTGEILALVSKPDFDPHKPGMSRENQLFNMATQGVYEMGSGMKSITIAVGLDTGSTRINDAYDLSYMKVSGFQVKDYHTMKGWHSVPHIFLKSSNIGVSQIILEIGKKRFLEYLKKLRLLDPLQIELPERARPLFPNIVRWSDLSLTTMSYGYGISESPAHFVQAMLPIVNGGIMHPLTLLKKNPDQPLVGERVFQEDTSLAMRKLMRLVVAEGTGSKAEVPEYYVGGKTGTANVFYAGKYDKNKRISSFFGIMPASNPEYMIYIVYNEPTGIKESLGFAGGGWTSAPTASAVFKRLIALYGVPKLDKNSKQVRELNDIKYKIRNEG